MAAPSADAVKNIDKLKATFTNITAEIGKKIIGQEDVIEQIIISILTDSNALLESYPGLGKTSMIKAVSETMNLKFSRVQGTPDLMPSDITGHAILDPSTRELRVVQGPVFTHLLLADEINRAPAKTQSALLEVMQEYQVTLEGKTLPLPKPFMVLATQNPIESEGTYPLPEAQLDRFLFKVEIGYPELAGEVAVVVRSTSNQAGNELPLSEVKPVLNERAVLSLQQIAGHQRVDDQVVDYAVRIVRATRETAGLALGAGSRGAISLVRGARAVALMEARNYVTPDDVKKVALPCLRHRIALAPDALLEGRKPNDLLAGIIETIPAPRM